MPNSLNTKQQIVSHSRGQKRIDLRAALEASPNTQENHNLTFGELTRAYLATHYNGADMQMRKWLDLLGNRSAWSITAEELARAGVAMLENGYSPSTVNRNLSTEQLVALHPDQFVGVQLNDGSAMSAVITLATGWINDMYEGFDQASPRYGIYGDSIGGPFVPNQTFVIGETGGTVLPAPPPIDINQYAGTWYEQGSVKEEPSSGLFKIVTVFTPQPDSTIALVNSGTYGPGGPAWTVTGSAVPVNPANTRFSVSFSAAPPTTVEPGNYWIIDYAPDYSWAIVGDPTGTSGSILTRDQFPSVAEYNALVARAYRLGVRGTITRTAQCP